MTIFVNQWSTRLKKCCYCCCWRSVTVKSWLVIGHLMSISAIIDPNLECRLSACSYSRGSHPCFASFHSSAKVAVARYILDQHQVNFVVSSSRSATKASFLQPGWEFYLLSLGLLLEASNSDESLKPSSNFRNQYSVCHPLH